MFQFAQQNVIPLFISCSIIQCRKKPCYLLHTCALLFNDSDETKKINVFQKLSDYKWPFCYAVPLHTVLQIHGHRQIVPSIRLFLNFETGYFNRPAKGCLCLFFFFLFPFYLLKKQKLNYSELKMRDLNNTNQPLLRFLSALV